MEWVFDVLIEEGYAYDSSIFPIRRPDYGWPGAPTSAYRIERPAGTLLELPLATLPAAGKRHPAAGGGYLRQFPYAVTVRAFARAAAGGEAAMFYIHPWEVDPAQPRLPLPFATRLRHYRGLEQTEALLDRLLRRFDWVSAAEAHGLERPAPSRREWCVPMLA
jgi:polysaccharide deacetylase family protein (PEP-CTERM system associated)